jgi:ATP-dependent Clp protease adaptor protein ClpS
VAAKIVLEPGTAPGTSTQREKVYNVIILNDEDHTMDYVVEMLQTTVRLSAQAALACTLEADATGSSIVYTCGLEEAENKRDLIHAYGPDWRIPHSPGSVAALVEPAAE